MRNRKEKKISVSLKNSRILTSIFFILFFILLRIWYLSIFQHEEKVQASEKPQKKTSIIKANRATIHDRYGLPLAINKVHYTVSVSYNEIKVIPRTSYLVDASGKKVKKPQRKEYITQLSHLLAKELHLEPLHVEDLIHSRAALLGKIPYLIKENISESEFYRLKMLEKDWPGLHANLSAKRYYPFGPVGGEVIGYMGPINRVEYDTITQELQSLQAFLQKCEEEEAEDLPAGYSSLEQVRERLKEIEEKVYTINDYVGKAGIEKAFEEKLRGSCGKKCFLADSRGNFLKEVPGDSLGGIPASVEPKEGSRLYLTLSKELQEYAERLLTEYEEGSLPALPIPSQGVWMKGGAIVVMDPNKGDVLALASYPRFNPNDFIRSKDSLENVQKSANVQRWLELDNYLSALWDGKGVIKRERFDVNKGVFYEEERRVDWKSYLEMILPSHSEVYLALKKMHSLKKALFLQKKVEELVSLFTGPEQKKIHPSFIFDTVFPEGKLIGGQILLPEKNHLLKVALEKKGEIEKLSQALAPYFCHLPLNYEKLLLADLSKIAINAPAFTPELVNYFGEQSLEEYRALSAHALAVQEGVKEILKEVFKKEFQKWREDHFKEYLAQKRREEEEKKIKSPRPYLDYLEEKEQEMFSHFWQRDRYPLLTLFIIGQALPSSLKKAELHPYITAIATARQKIEERRGLYAWEEHFFALKEPLEKVPFALLEEYLQTFRSFDELTRPLLGRYTGLKAQFEKDLAAAFYPVYGFGYLRSYAFRQPMAMGSIFKLVPAYEALRQKYLSQQGDALDEVKARDLNPLTIIDDKHKVGGKNDWNVGYTLDNRPIPLIYRGGRLPRSEHAGIGKVDLVRALETSSNPYFALLSGDVIEDPEDLCTAAATFSFGEKTGIDLPFEAKGEIPKDVIYNRSGLYAMSIGQHSLTGTPLQTAVMLSAVANKGKILKPKIVLSEITDGKHTAHPTQIVRHLFLPSSIRNCLIKGLQQVIQGESGTARELKNQFPEPLVKNVVGKTSTAEVMERVSLDGEEGYIKCKNISFGAIYFDPKVKNQEKAELVVVVYLRYGDYGRKAAPFALKMIQKYLEIQERQKSQ